MERLGKRLTMIVSQEIIPLRIVLLMWRYTRESSVRLVSIFTCYHFLPLINLGEGDFMANHACNVLNSLDNITVMIIMIKRHRTEVCVIQGGIIVTYS